MTKPRLLLTLVATAALVALATPTVAHHAFSAEFDADRPVHLEGPVVKMEWINPTPGCTSRSRTMTAPRPSGWSKAAP